MAKRQTYLRGARAIARNAFGSTRRKKLQEIVAAGVRTYSDTGQTQAYIEWSDGSHTEGDPENTHMRALLARAKREGVNVKLGEVF